MTCCDSDFYRRRKKSTTASGFLTFHFLTHDDCLWISNLLHHWLWLCDALLRHSFHHRSSTIEDSSGCFVGKRRNHVRWKLRFIGVWSAKAPLASPRPRKDYMVTQQERARREKNRRRREQMELMLLGSEEGTCPPMAVRRHCSEPIIHCSNEVDDDAAEAFPSRLPPPWRIYLA